MESFDLEVENIKTRYSKRHHCDEYTLNSLYITNEREIRYFEILNSLDKKREDLKIMEIGAGTGDNLLFFHRAGIPWCNIYANELLPDRAKILKENLPNSHLFIGNALELDFQNEFDIVFQSTVFTSILDFEFKKELANKMYQMAKPNSIILWYDFKYNNPNNKDVKGIKRKEIKTLFPLAKFIKFYNVTLAPPIGRKIGTAYNSFNSLFPFFRTHLIAVINK